MVNKIGQYTLGLRFGVAESRPLYKGIWQPVFTTALTAISTTISTTTSTTVSTVPQAPHETTYKVEQVVPPIQFRRESQSQIPIREKTT